MLTYLGSGGPWAADHGILVSAYKSRSTIDMIFCLQTPVAREDPSDLVDPGILSRAWPSMANIASP
jgi:hypothetical protein